MRFHQRNTKVVATTTLELLPAIFRRYGEGLGSALTSRSGAQVVRINAELLHFHSIPPASESSIGGVDLIGAKSAAQASVSNATISEGRFIAVLPSSGVYRLATFCWTRCFIHDHR
jgi:hypothetical protein